MNTFSIYIHVPWCRRRCPYCNFYVVVGRPFANFVDGIIKEWRSRRTLYGDVAQTLYFGGGTPSLLAPDDIQRLIDTFHKDGMLASDAEITLEANPEDLVASYVTALVKTAVNRISLGVQSFDDAILRQLGRKHTGAMAKDAILRLQDNGFKSISVDQIVGVPNENVDAILGSLNFLEKNQVGHISSYLLTIEEGTHFHRRNIAPSDEAQADIYLSVQRELSRLGYTQYDISSFAKPHRMSRHNQTYWSGHDYIGLGPGAHSMRKLADGSVERANNHAEIGAWLLYPDNARHFAAEILPPEAALREALAFGLRNMVTGINVPKLALRYQTVVPGSLPTIMAKYSNLGWLGKRGDTYAITPAGALFADAIMRDILCC